MEPERLKRKEEIRTKIPDKDTFIPASGYKEIVAPSYTYGVHTGGKLTAAYYREEQKKL